MGTATLTNSADVPISEEPSLEPVAGMRLGRYELLKRIASGGMAQVWSAQQLGEFGFRRACAVKVIRPEYATSTSFRRMFLDEARLAAGIHHPHVVEVFDLGEVGPMVYQAMELVRGCSLARLLARAGGDESSGSRRGLEAGVVCRIVADMAAGLHAAHELTDETGNPLQIVHRDVSPQNILVSVDGMAKIADFGVAKAFGRLADETDAGQLKGKLSYLSPEQAARRPLDRRSDVFAAGIVMWEALTGRRLFRGEDAVDTLARVRAMPVPDPREIAPDVPADVAAVVLRALERDPGKRFATAAEMSDGVEEAALASKRRIGSKQLAARVCEVLGFDSAASTIVSESAPAVARSPAEVPDGADVIASTLVDPPAPAPTRRRTIAAVALLGTALVMTGALARTRSGISPTAGEQPAPEPVAPAVVAPQPVLATVASTAASASASAPDPTAAEAPSARPRPAVHGTGRGMKKAPGTDPKLPFGNPY